MKTVEIKIVNVPDDPNINEAYIKDRLEAGYGVKVLRVTKSISDFGVFIAVADSPPSIFLNEITHEMSFGEINTKGINSQNR